MSKKMGFREVVSLVIGSQVGSGVFMLPASLALLGPISVFGWLISSSGAILLALVFAQLCIQLPKAGGPHAYVEAAFGREAAFFTSWVYWMISWVSSIAVIIAAVAYLSPLLNLHSPLQNLILEITLLLIITIINIRGTAFAGSMEFILTIFKCIPLLLIPMLGLFFGSAQNFEPMNPNNFELMDVLHQASLMTLWGFIGLESATVTTAAIDNPQKVIPKAVIIGTITVAGLYILNSIGVMAVVPLQELAGNKAPYVEASSHLFGKGWDKVVAIVASIACIGTLNAWVLTSGQIAYGAAKDNLLPEMLGKVNKYESPYMSLILSFLGSVPLLIMTLDKNLVVQVNKIIDISVTAFLFVYILCMLSYIKLNAHKKPIYLIISLLAVMFCSWALYYTDLSLILWSSIFFLSGLPVYLWQYKHFKRPVKAPKLT
ncbi:amino acid permease [Candidatus Odyssella thessalonicensis]|uniref:amino acid permease n=1 Tax=Candidatus Odyssella thessalonicensis TaxID=84647 RepID=UPI000225AC60|nr:amino acid permease [Candidatus Odyssella thessalonicensis]